MEPCRHTFWFRASSILLFFFAWACFGADEASTVKRYNGLLEKKRYLEARLLIDEALRQNPKSATLLVAKANLALIAGKPFPAVTLCKQALGISKNFDWAMSTLGKAYVELGRPDLGLQWIDAAIARSQNPTLLIERAELLLNLERHAEAEIAFAEAVKANPNNVDILVDRAWNLRKMHLDRAEERLLIEAVRRFPKDRRALMAYTNHLKDRRYYSKSLLFLERADPAKNPVYNPGFFTRTGLKGYSLSPLGVPFNFSFFDELGVEGTNLENLTRSLKTQGLNPQTLAPGLLPIPRLVPRNLFRGDVSIFAPLLPVIRLSFHDDRKLTREDGFFESRTDLITLSVETTFLWRGVGDITVLPFVRGAFQGGQSLDILSGNHGDFSIAKGTLGVLAYLQPLIGGPLYEVEGAQSVGDVHDTYLRAGAAVPLGELARLNGEIKYIWGNEYRFAANFARFSGRLGVEVGPRDGLRGRLELNAVTRVDKLNTGVTNTFTYLTPSFTGFAPLHRRWFLTGEASLLLNNRYREYAGISIAASVGHRFFPIFQRRMTHAEFPYESPIELRVGFQSNFFNQLPTGPVSPFGFVASLNLFW